MDLQIDAGGFDTWVGELAESALRVTDLEFWKQLPTGADTELGLQSQAQLAGFVSGSGLDLHAESS